jgi:hypothetical protein
VAEVSDAAIFCARCGAAGQKVESYCRSCGEWLPDPAPAAHLPGRLRGLSPERKQRRIHILQILSALAALAAALVTLAVHLGLHPDMLVLSILLCFLVVAWQGVSFFIGRSIQGMRSQGTAEGGPALPAAKGAARPSMNAADTAGLVRPPSVTENTTALLDPVPLKKDGGRK